MSVEQIQGDAGEQWHICRRSHCGVSGPKGGVSSPKGHVSLRGGVMQIEVGPARRPGTPSSIYNEPLTSENFRADGKGNVFLTIDACGMNCSKSLYRYKLRLSREEARELLQAVGN
jgi:hypothetical protein